MADKEKKKMNPALSLIGGIIMTIILVVVVPVVVSWLIQPYVEDLIGDMSLDVIGLTSGAIGAIVMFLIMLAFMMLLGGGSILRRFGIIGIAGLILAYVFLLNDTWGWVIPVILVIVLGVISYFRDKKKGKSKK